MPLHHTYRLSVHKNDTLLGHFESSTPWAKSALQDIAGRLSADDGYRLECFVAEDERRIVEAGPGGVKVLCSEHVFKTMALEDLVEC